MRTLRLNLNWTEATTLGHATNPPPAQNWLDRTMLQTLATEPIQLQPRTNRSTAQLRPAPRTPASTEFLMSGLALSRQESHLHGLLAGLALGGISLGIIKLTAAVGQWESWVRLVENWLR